MPCRVEGHFAPTDRPTNEHMHRTIELLHAMFLLCNQRMWQSQLFPVLDGLASCTFEMKCDLELRFDSALAVLGRNARDLNPKAIEWFMCSMRDNKRQSS
jgi:hypothetical protein